MSDQLLQTELTLSGDNITMPRKHEMLAQRRFTVGPPSTTLAQQ